MIQKNAVKQLTFNEIPDWQTFEDLVAAYFIATKDSDEFQGIKNVDISQTGIGSDGGRDILVTFRMSDSITDFERRWVVQCKFWENVVSKKDIFNINIPTLVHEYKAQGYLLVLKNHATSELTKSFESLNQNCKFGYCYLIWHGNIFRDKLLTIPKLFPSYFPEYNEFIYEKYKPYEDI